MTPYARRMLAAGMIGATIAAAGAVAKDATAPRPEPARCTRDPLVRGAWLCTFPTPARPARVYVTAWEDGSARAVAIDPDAPNPWRHTR